MYMPGMTEKGETAGDDRIGKRLGRVPIGLVEGGLVSGDKGLAGGLFLGG